LPDILLVLVGAAAGGTGVWLWLARRTHERIETALAESSRKATRAVDWAKSEAAMQIERRDQEIAALRARQDEHDHSVEQVRARLQADLALAQRERAQWESRVSEVSARGEQLSSQLQAIKDEGLRDLERLRSLGRNLEGVVSAYAAVLQTMEAGVRSPVSTESVSGRAAGQPPGDVFLPASVRRPR
jgi:hypothetical protein